MPKCGSEKILIHSQQTRALTCLALTGFGGNVIVSPDCRKGGPLSIVISVGKGDPWMFSMADEEVSCLSCFRMGLSVLSVTSHTRPSQGAPDVAQSAVDRLPKLTLM